MWIVTRRQLIQHFSSPSTWRGIVLLCSALGYTFRPDLGEAIIAAGVGLAGLIGALTTDPAPPSTSETE